LGLTKVVEQVGSPERDVDEVTNLSDLLIKSSDSCVGISALEPVGNPHGELIHIVRYNKE